MKIIMRPITLRIYYRYYFSAFLRTIRKDYLTRGLARPERLPSNYQIPTNLSCAAHLSQGNWEIIAEKACTEILLCLVVLLYVCIGEKEREKERKREIVCVIVSVHESLSVCFFECL